MENYFEKYSKVIGLFLLSIVIITFFSTPFTIFGGGITTIGAELSRATGNEIPVQTKMDFGNNEHIRAFPKRIGDWNGSDYDTTSAAERLGADVMLMRAYSHPKLYQPVSFLIMQSKNRSSFHPPVVCYPASGYTIEEEGTEDVFVHNVIWASKPVFPTLEGRNEEMGYFNGTMSVKKLIVVKKSKNGNVTARKVVLYFYVKESPFTSNTVTMIRVSAPAPFEGSYEGSLNITKEFMGAIFPCMFELRRKEPFILFILFSSLAGKVVVGLSVLLPMLIMFYPQIRRLRTKTIR
ncbi:MAG: exosortase-associated EpsI family protein [Nitrospiraceae bacterium]|nr:exosortase-associated EpsI family protein [Nitrospiraceae bacterium]